VVEGGRVKVAYVVVEAFVVEEDVVFLEEC
jgi:hypothetical protein